MWDCWSHMWQYESGSQGLSVEANMPAEWDRGMQWMQVDNEELTALGPPRPALAPRRRTNASSIVPRVLIADDYVDAAKSLALVLSIAGVQTEIAMDGAEALARAELWNPHVCVLDLLMPIMNGWEFRMEQVQDALLAEIPVLVVSSEPDVRGEATALRVETCVAKPIDAHTLLEEVRHMVPRP